MSLPSPATITSAVRDRVLAVPAWVLVVEVFIGAGWLRACAQKVISAEWWTGDGLAAFLTETDEARVPWFDVVVDLIIAPNLIAVSAIVAALQLLVGLGLVSGRYRVPALFVGMAMNVAFVLAGAVTPSAFYLLAQLAVLLWVVEAGRSVWGRAIASVVALSGLALAGSAVLSIGTLHPDHVIEDPSMMLVFLGLLSAFGAERAQVARESRPPREPVSLVEHAAG